MRSQLLTTVCAGLAGLLLTGCTPVWERQAHATVQRAEERPALQQARRLAASVAAPAGGPADGVEPPAAAELAQLVAWALPRHPGLRARLAAISGAQARVRAAGSLPEPRLSLVPVGQMAQTASGEVDLMAGLSQTFPSPGTLSGRTLAADALTQEAIAALRAEEVAVARSIRQAWWRWHTAAAATTILSEQITVLDRLFASLEARLATNQARHGELLRLQVEQGELRTRRRHWQEERTLGSAALRAALSLPAATPLPAPPPDAGPQAPAQDVAWFQAAARQHRPDYQRNRAAETRAAGLAAAARGRRLPDLTLSAQYNRVDDAGLSPVADGEDQWWLGVGVSLPIWFDTYAAADDEAAAARRQAAWQREAIDDSVRRDVDSAWATLQSALERQERFAGELVPAAERALRVEESAYATGEGGYLDLISAWRRYLALQLDELQLRRAAGLAVAELWASAGLTLPPAVRSTMEEHEHEQQ